jgi:hypothetical protein
MIGFCEHGGTDAGLSSMLLLLLLDSNFTANVGNK